MDENSFYIYVLKIKLIQLNLNGKTLNALQLIDVLFILLKFYLIQQNLYLTLSIIYCYISDASFHPI